MKCSLLIVEDHALTARYLSNNIDWESVDVEVVGVASNGKEALSMIERQVPDILLTDIRMPVMDGLRLISHLNKKEIHVKPIILTAYDEFSYAQEAIRLGAVDYVLKPIEDGVLKDTVHRVQQEITSAKDKELRYNFLLEKMRKRFPVIRNDFFLKLLKGTYEQAASLEETVSFLSLSFSTYYFCVLVTEIDRSEATSCADRKQQERLNSDLIDAVEEVIQKEYCLYPVSMEQTTAFVICCKKQGSDVEIRNIGDLCKQAQALFYKKTGGFFRPGPIPAHYGLTQLAGCYAEAMGAIKHKFLSGPSRVFIFTHSDVTGTDDGSRPTTGAGSRSASERDSENMNSFSPYGTEFTADGTLITGRMTSTGLEAETSFIYPFNHEQQLITYTSIGKKDAALSELDNFFSLFENHHCLSDEYIKEAVITMIMRAVNTVRQEMESDSLEHNDLSPRTIVELTTVDSLEELKKECDKIIRHLCDLARELHSNVAHHAVEKAMGYISLHYHEDFTIEDVASFVGYNPNYFSHIFKKYMRKSFSRVLTEYRVDQAKRLLRKPYLRISEIAERVGYHDPQYFSQIFGLITGMCPSKYRKQQEKSP